MIPTSELLYEGTLQTMTCNVTLPDTVDTNVNVTIDWILGTNIIITTSDRIIISPVSSMMSPFISTLTFNPLIISDAGQYYCQSTADSTSPYITTSTTLGNSLVETITVTGISHPPPPPPTHTHRQSLYYLFVTSHYDMFGYNTLSYFKHVHFRNRGHYCIW